MPVDVLGAIFLLPETAAGGPAGGLSYMVWPQSGTPVEPAMLAHAHYLPGKPAFNEPA